MDQQSHPIDLNQGPTAQYYKDAIAYLRRELDAATDPARIAELKDDLEEIFNDAGNFAAAAWLDDDD